MLNISNFFMVLADEEMQAQENVALDLVRLIFGVLCRFVYDFIAKITDILYDIALVLNISGDGITKLANNLSDKLFAVILIYMIFRGTITMLNYIIDPDSFQDKAKGGAAFIKRTIITIVLLISINPIFNILGTLQADIIDSDIITNLFLGSKNNMVYENSSGEDIYVMSISTECLDSYMVPTSSKGEHLALETLKPFIQPAPDANMDQLNEDTAYCGVDASGLASGETDSFEFALGSVKTTAKDYLGPSVYNHTYDSDEGTGEQFYDIDFNFFFCLVVGIVVLLILISFTFDVVIRAFNLIVLKVLAPVPIIGYMSPKGKDSEMLGTWIHKVITTWVSLFIRLIALEFALSIISIVCDGDVLPSNSIGIIESIFIICGALMFAKKLPQLLEEIIPGFKGVGSFELNPFKRISNEALGGKALLGVGAGAGAMALGAATNFTQRAIDTGQSVAKAEGVKGKAFALGGGLARTAGSTIAGGARAGINAFNRTRKDGNMFRGLWNGYGTAMFSKKQREDNLRKAGIIDDDGTYMAGKDFRDSIWFGMQSVGADAARYVGVLNAGQKEILKAAAQDKDIKKRQEALAAQKRQDAEAKAIELKPYELYTEQAVKIKNRLKAIVDNDSKVKEQQALLDNAIATGDANRIHLATDALKNAKKEARIKAFKTDYELNERVTELKNLKDQYKTQLSGFNVLSINANKEIEDVDDLRLSEVQYRQEIISNKYKAKEAGYAEKEREIETIKNSREYIEAHDENSQAKLANATRLNTEIEGPGFKPATSGSSQSEITDEARYHLGPTSGGRTGGGPRPPGVGPIIGGGSQTGGGGH